MSCLVALLLAAGLPLAGTANPDPSRVQVRSGQVVEVTAAGALDVVGPHPLAQVSPYAEDIRDLARGGDVVTADVRNVQWAVQNVAAGGLVRLVAGPRGEVFQFGSSGIYLPGVRLVGAGRDESGAPRTVIAAGQLAVRVDFLVPGDRARISDLWFKDTLEGAIYTGMAEYDRLEVSGNRSSGTIAEPFLVHPPQGQFFDGDLHFFFLGNGAAGVAPFTGVHAPRCHIDEVILRDNVSDQLPPAGSSSGGSELELAFCNARSIRIDGNVVRSLALPVELHENTGDAIEVTGNSLSAASTTALWVFGNAGGSVRIEGNLLSASGPGSVGMILSHHTPQASFLVADNQLALDGAVAAIFPGLAQPGSDPLAGAVFTGNRLSGSAAFGVLAYDSPPWLNAANEDVFVGNDFSQLSTAVLQVFLDASTHDNVFKDNPGLAPAGFFSLNPTNRLK